MARAHRTITVADAPEASRADAPAPREPRGRWPAAIALAALLAGASLTGCSSSDGGIIGTGDGELGDASTDEGTDAAVGGGIDSPDADVREFDNSDASAGGIDAGLRVVNVSARTVRLEIDDEVREASIGPGGVGDRLSLAGGRVRDLAVVDVGDGRTLGAIRANLAVGSLTTLVVFDVGDDAVAVEPLVTRTGTDDAAVALVRVVHVVDPSDPAARIGAVSLVPDGDAPGGAEVDFAPGETSPIASDYLSVAAGDYRVVTDDAGDLGTLSIEGGSAYTLLFSDDDGAPTLPPLVDGDGS